MPFILPPDPIATDSTREMWKRIRTKQPPLPSTIGRSEFDKQAQFARPLGEHLPDYAAQGADDLLAFSFLLLLFIALHILMRNWEGAGLLALFIALNVVAALTARRPEISNGLLRLICSIYFSTVFSSPPRRPVRRILRLPILFCLIILPLLTCLPIVRHHRPPFVDPRLINWRSGQYWGYLREHHFFRDPPPPVPTPENP